MREIIAKLNHKREKGKIYYIAFDEDNYLLLGKADLKRGGRKKKEVENDKT